MIFDKNVRSHPCKALLASLALASTCAVASDAPLHYRQQILEVGGEERTVRVPQGFRLELLADGLGEPRLMAFADNGDLFIGSSSAVYRLPPPYTDASVLIELDDYPHSVAFREGEILIAQEHGLYRAPYRPGQAQIEAGDVSLLAALPGGGGHNNRSVAVGPDGRVYVSLGISDNCVDEYVGEAYPFKSRRGGVLWLNERGAEPRWEVYASGLRNPIGFDWQPGSGTMYLSNNGPDHLGYDQPPEYFSRAQAGSYHGMPWFQFDGEQIERDRCIDGTPPRPQAQVTPPVATFPARNAPMGVAFVRGQALGASLTGDAIVALHGSWATLPDGRGSGDPATKPPPKVVAVRFAGGKARRVDDLVTGFQLPDGERWARPVGVAIGPDGALYFTSDGGASAGLLRWFTAGTGALFRLTPLGESASK